MRSIVSQRDQYTYRFAGDCPPGQICNEDQPAVGQVDGKETAGPSKGNSGTDYTAKDPGVGPIYQGTGGSFGPNGGYGGGGGVGSSAGSSSGGSGGTSGPRNDAVGEGGIMDISRPLYDQLKAIDPNATIGGYRPGGDGYDEHNNGALDFMTTDQAQFEKIRDTAFANGAPYVLWQQTQWNPDGTSSPMEDRGSPTQNHMDHVHTGPLQ